jgi:hypothetical protein
LVISGSPVDIWAAKGYGTSHSQETLRKQHGIGEEDVVVLVVGSYLFFDELPWDYAAFLRASAPHIMEIARTRKLRVQFILFCGNGTDAYNSAFQVLIIFKFYRIVGGLPCTLENSNIFLEAWTAKFYSLRP